MQKKILFLRVDTGWKDPSPPLAFAFLGRIARDNGFEIFVENLNAQYNTRNVEDILNLIKIEKPLIVGITISTTHAKISYDLIKKIRNYCNVIIAGGPHVTVRPEEVLKNGVDIAVVGEAESSFSDLLNAVYLKKELSKVRGIFYKEKDKIKKTEPPEAMDLDKIPIPDRDIFRKSDYVRIKEEINNFGGILSSRGCPGRCTYCYNQLFGRRFRYRSAENVFEEIVYLYKKYGVTHINFIDDAFTINRGRLNELCDLLVKAKLPIEWVCATRIDFLDREVIFKMKKAGCVMISLGVESCIPSTLIKMKKTTNPEWYIPHSEDVLKWCYEAEIRAGVNILTGFPWDSVEDIKKLQKYVKEISKYVTQGFCGGILQPMPNTEIYEEYAKKYNFENWWLDKESVFEGKYRPFFAVYYHVFWEQLENNFFNLDKKVFNEIDRLYRIMGKWNLNIMVKRRFKNWFVRHLLYSGLLFFSNLSMFLFKISPNLERGLMQPVITFGYRFKYKQ
ncbi:MAG: radical SAM protein [Nanoarchaeota archaeon]